MRNFFPLLIIGVVLLVPACKSNISGTYYSDGGGFLGLFFDGYITLQKEGRDVVAVSFYGENVRDRGIHLVGKQKGSVEKDGTIYLNGGLGLCIQVDGGSGPVQMYITGIQMIGEDDILVLAEDNPSFQGKHESYEMVFHRVL